MGIPPISPVSLPAGDRAKSGRALRTAKIHGLFPILISFFQQLLHPDSTRWIPDRISLQAPSVCIALQMPILLRILFSLKDMFFLNMCIEFK
jgi:hypothetical protein